MATIRWNPWNVDRFFEDNWDIPTIPVLSRLAGQGLNLYETEQEVIAEAAVPGIPEDKIDVTVDNGIVRITGSTEQTKEEKEKRRYFMSSMNSSFNYTFRLPEGVAADKEPECELNDGVLTLRFEKVKKAPPKKVKIKKVSREKKSA